jgi:serine/threonine protein kinase
MYLSILNMITSVNIVNSRHNSSVMNIRYKDVDHVSKMFVINEANFMDANLFREICITKKLKHKNIIGNYGVVVDNYNVYILLERGDCGLIRLIANNVFDNSIDRKRLVSDVSEGLKYLHNNNINHCDLSLNNIMVVNGIYKIIDFGNAIKGHRFNTYLPPTPYIETFDKPSHIKSDIWALGFISHVVYFNKFPFYGRDKLSQLKQISEYIIKRSHTKNVLYTCNSDHDIINDMLEPNSTIRKQIYLCANKNTNSLDTNRGKYQYNVHMSWKIRLIESIMNIGIDNIRYDNIYITLLNSYKLKSSSFKMYILNTICIFWLSFKLTANNNIYIADLRDWLVKCGCDNKMCNKKLTNRLKNIMIAIDWDFDDKNVLDCISIRGIDCKTIRIDSLILYMDLSMCRMNEDKKYNQLVKYYHENNHNRVSYNLSIIIDKLDEIKPDFLFNLQKFAEKTLNNICIQFNHKNG